LTDVDLTFGVEEGWTGARRLAAERDVHAEHELVDGDYAGAAAVTDAHPPAGAARRQQQSGDDDECS
jgi:hypothetical protein